MLNVYLKMYSNTSFAQTPYYTARMRFVAVIPYNVCVFVSQTYLIDDLIGMLRQANGRGSSDRQQTERERNGSGGGGPHGSVLGHGVCLYRFVCPSCAHTARARRQTVKWSQVRRHTIVCSSVDDDVRVRV